MVTVVVLRSPEVCCQLANVDAIVPKQRFVETKEALVANPVDKQKLVVSARASSAKRWSSCAADSTFHGLLRPGTYSPD